MKHKRMAILFVLVTFAGSPPVWQKLGNFISAVQHRAQIKFLSMVLSPGTGEVPALEDQTTLNGPVASCSGEKVGQKVGQMPRASTAQQPSSLGKIKSEGRGAARSEEPQTLAQKREAKDLKIESLSHIHALLPKTPNRLAMQALAAIPRERAMDENEILEFVVLPQSDSFAPAVIKNTNLHRRLRKALDENKVSGQKTRFVIGKPFPVPPASKADAASSEREG